MFDVDFVFLLGSSTGTIRPLHAVNSFEILLMQA